MTSFTSSGKPPFKRRLARLDRCCPMFSSTPKATRSFRCCGVIPSGPPAEPAGKEDIAFETSSFETCNAKKRSELSGSHGVLRSTGAGGCLCSVSYTHLRAHETPEH